MNSRSRGTKRPRFASISRPPQKQRAQGMPDARCTRDLMRSVHRKCAHEHTGQRRTSDIPYAMALRLMPCSPRRRIRLASVVGGLRLIEPGWVDFASADLTPATGARTTRFCRTKQRRRQRAGRSLTEVFRPANPFTPDAAASTAPRPNVRDDGQRPSGRDGMARDVPLICPSGKAKYFLFWGLTRFLITRSDLPVGSICRVCSPLRVGTGVEKPTRIG